MVSCLTLCNVWLHQIPVCTSFKLLRKYARQNSPTYGQFPKIPALRNFMLTLCRKQIYCTIYFCLSQSESLQSLFIVNLIFDDVHHDRFTLVHYMAIVDPVAKAKTHKSQWKQNSAFNFQSLRKAKFKLVWAWSNPQSQYSKQSLFQSFLLLNINHVVLLD